MKKIITSLTAISMLICIASCDKDYPEEVTYSGKNIHGFKMNSEKWVTYITGFNHIGIDYDTLNSLLQFYLISKQEKVARYPNGKLYIQLIIKKEDFNSGKIFPFTGFGDKIWDINYPNNLDSSLAYCEFSYNNEQSKKSTYSEVISGELKFSRLDSIAVGIFEAKLSNGIDTITITDGKFDYQLTTE